MSQLDEKNPAIELHSPSPPASSVHVCPALHASTVNLAADGGYCISDFAMDVDVGYVAVTTDEIADCEKHARARFFFSHEFAGSLEPRSRATCASFDAGRRATVVAKNLLKIATYNVNGVRSRLPNLLEWLSREKPDVVCLQELKANNEQLPQLEIEAAGYGSIWMGQASWNGVAILARGSEPIESRRGLPGSKGDDQSRYLEAAAHGVMVGCLYLPNGNPQPGPKFDYKLKWFDRLIKHAAALYGCGHPVVLAGDYNVVPTDADIYDSKSWRNNALLGPESRERYECLLEQGWVDSLRHQHPDAPIFTFWDYFRKHWERDKGLRIDHLLLNNTLAPRLRAAGVDRWVRGQPHASDHAPTWITLSK